MANGVTVTTHYQKSDIDHEWDYDSIDVRLTIDGIVYGQSYGDAYHDHGWYKVEGFVDAIKSIYGDKFPVIYVDVSDIEDYEDYEDAQS